MERVVKRFLLYNQNEHVQVKESDFDHLRDKMNMTRYETMNDIKSMRESLMGYANLLFSGFNILSNKFTKSEMRKHNYSFETLNKLNMFKNSSKMLKKQLKNIDEFNNFSKMFQMVAENKKEDFKTESDSDDEIEKDFEDY
jgi:hypothetical protein